MHLNVSSVAFTNLLEKVLKVGFYFEFRYRRLKVRGQVADSKHKAK